jgi:hypothetical protein
LSFSLGDRALGRVALVLIALTALAASTLTGTPVLAEMNPASPTASWRLLYAESFATSITDGTVPWSRDYGGATSRYHVDGYDDDGAYFDAMGGAAFRSQLSTFWQYRKAVPLGTNGWLTAELAARDTNRDGKPDGAPSIRTSSVGGQSALLMSEPDHRGGVILRSTNALPPQYRVEMTLRALEFGGMRGGSWDYPDGRVNGYTPSGCKTNFPWAPGGDFSRSYCKWTNVRTDSNGFYYLSIVDYPRPAPHNNIFIHTHRKVAMDGYNRYKYTGSGLVYCNPLTKAYEPYSSGSGNGVNAIFMTSTRRYTNQPGNQYVMDSECGTRSSGAIVSQADLQPELLPSQPYKFAIERVNGGYTMEISGNFHHVGQATLRYHRAFVQDGLPIWHYNQRAEEYDGRFNLTWSYSGAGGTYTHANTWPAGSAYPDYLLIGDPHLNYYEGQAHIDDVKLYVPQ